MGASQYSVTREIAAPADRVFALLTNLDDYRWNPAVRSIEGRAAVGETVKLVSSVDPKRTFKLKVRELTAPTRMVWQGGMPLGLFTGTRTYSIKPAGDTCVFTMTEAFTGPMAGLITKSMPDLTESFDQFADGLKQAAEQQG